MNKVLWLLHALCCYQQSVSNVNAMISCILISVKQENTIIGTIFKITPSCTITIFVEVELPATGSTTNGSCNSRSDEHDSIAVDETEFKTISPPSIRSLKHGVSPPSSSISNDKKVKANNQMSHAKTTAVSVWIPKPSIAIDLAIRQVIKWMEACSISDPSFGDMKSYLTDHCSIPRPPCRATMAKWLEGEIIIQDRSITAIVYHQICEVHRVLTVPGFHDDTVASVAEALAVQMGHVYAQAVDELTNMCRQLGTSTDDLLFIGELETTMWTKHPRNVIDEDDMDDYASAESHNAAVLVTFVAISIRFGIVHIHSTPCSQNKIGVAAFIIDALVELRKKLKITPPNMTKTVTIAIGESRAAELAVLPSRLNVTVMPISSMESGLVNIASLVIEESRQIIHDQKRLRYAAVMREFDDWDEKVQHRQRLLMAIIHEACSSVSKMMLTRGAARVVSISKF